MQYPTAAARYAQRLKVVAGDLRYLLKDGVRADVIEQIARDVDSMPKSDGLVRLITANITPTSLRAHHGGQSAARATIIAI